MNKLADSIDFFLNRSFGRTQSMVNALERLQSALLSRFGTDQRYLVNSIPKSGTHFIEKLLVNSGQLKKSGFFFSDIHHNRYPRDFSDYASQLKLVAGRHFCGAHMPYSISNNSVLAENNFRHILLIRHPADVLVSQYHHCLQRPTNRVHHIISECRSFREGIKVLLEGYRFPDTAEPKIPDLEPFVSYFDSFHGWLDQDILLCRYEDLIAPPNDAGKSTHSVALKGLIETLAGEDVTAETLNAVYEKSYGKSNTFRSGKIGGWRESVNQEDEAFIDTNLLELCTRFG
ncbi:MAG: hypothetical protein HKN85_13025, partial [Gammaproteobacteria bacterium]|nr:hypothetical protein [Gammaproteobacteria bacterium]